MCVVCVCMCMCKGAQACVCLCACVENRIIKIQTCGYGYGCIKFIISNKTRNPCVKIIIPSSDITNAETSKTISRGPKLVALERYQNVGYLNYVSNTTQLANKKSKCYYRKFSIILILTLDSLCHDPDSPGKARPTYAESAYMY